MLHMVAIVMMALAVTSCETSRSNFDTYGEPGPGKIRIMIAGSSEMKRGIYYFANGTTLQAALVASGYTEDKLSGKRFYYERYDGENRERKSYALLKMSVAEREQIVLHDFDTIDFRYQPF